MFEHAYIVLLHHLILPSTDCLSEGFEIFTPVVLVVVMMMMVNSKDSSVSLDPTIRGCKVISDYFITGHLIREAFTSLLRDLERRHTATLEVFLVLRGMSLVIEGRAVLSAIKI